MKKTEKVQESAEGKIITLENGKNGIGIGLIDRTEVTSDVPIRFQQQVSGAKRRSHV